MRALYEDQRYYPEVRVLLLQIFGGTSRELLPLLRRLSSIGIASRRSILPRGSPEIAASNRFPDSEKCCLLIEMLDQLEGEPRRQLVSVLGEWGGAQAVTAICTLMDRVPSSEDPELYAFCIGALSLIGGRIALERLRSLCINEGSIPITNMAHYAFRELVTGGMVDYSEGYTSEQKTLLDRYGVRR